MKIIITGAGGLLGHQVALEARRAGYGTVGIGRATQPPAGLACDQWVASDLMDPQLLECAWAVETGAPVIHLAADTRIYQPGLDFCRDSIASAEQACRLAQLTGGRLVFLSSAAVYSGPRTCRPIMALRETDATQPCSAYGKSKLAAEAVIAKSGVDAVVLRLFGVLSERLVVLPDRGNLVQAIVRVWRTGEEVLIATDEFGQPPVRDYMLAEDVGRSVIATLGWHRTGNGPVIANLCTGIATDALAMVEMARLVSGRNIRVRRVIQQAPVNPVMVGDATALKAKLGLVPESRVREFWTRMWREQGPVPTVF